VLVGRSALPPASQWESALCEDNRPESEKERIRKLVEIRSLAGGMLIAQADVTDLGQMKTAVAQAREQFGRIDGVFHAAGVLDDGPLMLKTATSAKRVLDPKVRGTLVLEEALRGESLACFVLFSSVSSILPPAGQVDYAAANAFLDAFALSRKGPVTAVNWGPWSGIGMAARAASSHPWLKEHLLETPTEAVYAGRFSPVQSWVLSEHKLKHGQAVIPGAAHLELAAHTFARGALRGAIEFQNVFFLVPIMFSRDESKEVRAQLRREQEAGHGNGAFRFSIFAEEGDRKSGKWLECSTGIVAPCPMRPAAQADRAAIAARCCERELSFDEQRLSEWERQFDFGPRWRSLRRLYVGKRETLAEIELDQKFSADLSSFSIHPALLDMATAGSLYLTEGYERSSDLLLPLSYRRMRLYRPLPGRFFSHVRSRREDALRGEVETFDITIFDEQNQVLAEIEGFAMRRIADPVKAMEDAGSPRDAIRGHGEQLIEVAIRPGIPPLEGARTLTRILSADTPAVVVAVPQPLQELLSSAPAPAPHKPSAASARGAEENIEETLAAWWQELLGVDQVGLDDDFFSLGGHSLIGVRLIAKIKKTFQVDLELAVLFEARTLRQLATLIGGARRPAPQVVVEAQTQKAWAALVPVQPNGSKVPLFCVHANSGDVLFYEQLARALGPDQPFYAFQSPLLAQPDRTDITFEEMAALYIREMRAFYPSGPYLLGSASFGGYLLYEMARQLEEQGISPSLVLIIDLAVPGSGERLNTRAKLGRFFENIREGGFRYLSKKVREKSAYFWEECFLKGAVYPAMLRACLAAKIPLPGALRFYYHSKAHWRIFAGYKLKPFPGKITLVRVADRGWEVLGRLDDPMLGWGSLALGGVEIIDLPTGHFDMLFEPYVETFAEKLKAILPS
jgi:thioesterase domain-containing protein/acyl carrier protein